MLPASDSASGPFNSQGIENIDEKGRVLYWLAGDYFCKYLIGDSETGTDIMQPNREMEQVGEKKRNRNR